uniref:Uncharacterized protein n=1 Tax=Lactiplantibacillus plantarum TaxID=1590 RepID=L0B1T9_LACPN|nr:hypothetical protein [Lactiplantibacillus plantarum]
MSNKAKFALTTGITVAIVQYVYTIFLEPLIKSNQLNAMINIIIILLILLIIYMIFKNKNKQGK